METIVAQREKFHTDAKAREDQLKDLKNENKTLRNFIGSMADDLERDIPSFLEQTGWDCGIYAIPDSEEEWFFNPTIIDNQGQKVLVTRRIWQTHQHYVNGIRLYAIDGPHVGPSQNLDIPMSQMNESFEDPRAFFDGRKWWLSVTDFIQGQTAGHQLVIPLDDMLRPERMYHPRIGGNGTSIWANTITEKNWMWFFYKGEPHVIYYTHPHTVYRVDWFAGPVDKYEEPIVGATWMHGEPRGGTPPVRVGDEYWSFFHSFTPWKYPRRRYHMGAYAFEAEPPFRVTRFGTLPLLSGSAKDPVRDPLPLVIFPGGALLEDCTWHVVFGVNDLKCGWIKIPHKDLVDLTRKLDPKCKVGFIPDQKSIRREPIKIGPREFV